MEESWQGLQVEGCSAYMLKEKLKLFKAKLKQWNKEVFGDINRKQSEIVEKLNSLELKAEVEDLDHNELVLKKALGADFWRVAHMKESLLRQKSRTCG